MGLGRRSADDSYQEQELGSHTDQLRFCAHDNGLWGQESTLFILHKPCKAGLREDSSEVRARVQGLPLQQESGCCAGERRHC